MGDTKVMESGKRRTFSDEFKQDAVRLIAVETYTFKAAARALGPSAVRATSPAPSPARCGQLLATLTVSSSARSS